MDRDSPADDTTEANDFVDTIITRGARAIVDKVSKIAPMPGAICREGVQDSITGGVRKVVTGAGAIGEGEVAVDVDVEAVQWVEETGDFGGDTGVTGELVRFGVALEPDGVEVDDTGGFPTLGGLDVAHKGGKTSATDFGKLGELSGFLTGGFEFDQVGASGKHDEGGGDKKDE